MQEKIIKLLAEGKSQRQIAKQLGISRHQVARVSNEQVSKLQAEIVHLREEKKSLNRSVKTSAKYQGLFQVACDVINKKIQPFEPPPIFDLLIEPHNIVEDLVLYVSDGHHDQVVTKQQTGGLEEYNFDISCARAERLVQMAIEHSQHHLPNYRFENLWWLALGDNTSGKIHEHEKRSHFKNIFTNCLKIGELHALMIRDLAQYFKRINCVYISGNHGRTTTKKDHYGPQENYDYLIGNIAKLWLQNCPNVQFLIPDSFSVNLNIRGHGFHLCHGDDIRSNLGIPFYGMVRKHKNLMALNNVSNQLRIKYFAMGHHHTLASLADLDGELLVNGAWLSCDPFSFNTFSSYREPCQLMHGVHNKWGVTWRLPIYLKSKYVPERYKIE